MAVKCKRNSFKKNDCDVRKFAPSKITEREGELFVFRLNMPNIIVPVLLQVFVKHLCEKYTLYTDKSNFC